MVRGTLGATACLGVHYITEDYGPTLANLHLPLINEYGLRLPFVLSVEDKDKHSGEN